MYDPIEITKLYVFGTNNPSSNDYNEHIRAIGATPASITYSMSDYMTSGGGRFAYPSLFGAVERFFNSVIADGTYTYGQISSLLGLGAADLRVNISQYGTGVGSADHAERSYIFGNSPFELRFDPSITNPFEVVGGIKTINGLEVRAVNDNFDFESAPGSFSQLINSVLLEPTFDPYKLNRGAVSINFAGSGKTYATYSGANFIADQAFESDVNAGNLAGIANLATNGGISYFQNIYSDTFLSFERGDLKVIYGTPENDNLNESNAEFSFDIYFGYLMVGGAGNDTLNGGTFADELQGGEGNDTLNGGLGDDVFIGGSGDDVMDGGSFLFGTFQGTDKSVYKGALSDYDVEFLPDDTIRISDKVNSRDGSDTLKGVDIAVFSDKSINLAPGQDIAFVIDTTGSMFDDIDAVKASASSVVNAIFDGERGFIDSRIAVVGYNDPDTNTFLSFTDQPKIDDRKTAAISAINSISVGGGGDFPEAVNAGLIRALSGGAGEWRPEAIARRIILFGDAPPNDNELRAQVLELAANVDVSISNRVAPMSIVGDVETSSVARGLTVTRFAMETTAADGTPVTVPVEIFTILIGSDPTTSADFKSLADATGGSAFTAANATEIVGAIIEAINTANQSPIASPDFAPTENDMSVTIDVLANDRDPNRDPLRVTKVESQTFEAGKQATLVSGALVKFNSDGTVTYDPNGKFASLTVGQSTTDTFTYTVSDDTGRIDTATVTVNITGKANNFVLGTEVSDMLYGDNSDDFINGLGGDDQIFGGEGNNFLLGGAGNDILYAGSGNDRLDGGDGNDLLFGSEGRNTLLGGAGDDTIYGGTSDDLIDGGNGNNQIYAAEGNNLIGTGSGNDVVYAGAGSDWVFTGEGNDVIYAAEGNNLIAAGAGDNIIYSGSGSDLFVLTSGVGSTIINQFQSNDRLGLIGGLSYNQLSITQSQQGNEFSTDISITETGDKLASLKWVEASSITRDSFVDALSLGMSLPNGAPSRSLLAGLMTSGVETGLSVSSVLDLQQQAIASGSPFNLAKSIV
jgi:VCBS repeat-containing protein